MRPEKAPEISCFESLWTSPSTVSMLSLLMCTRHACHMCRDLDYCSKQGRGTSQRAIIATYHRSVKQWKVFIDLESIVFSGSTRLLWIRVSLQSVLLCIQSVLLCKHECHYVSGISQSNFNIFHNKTESVIIMSKSFEFSCEKPL